MKVEISLNETLKKEKLSLHDLNKNLDRNILNLNENILEQTKEIRILKENISVLDNNKIELVTNSKEFK